MKFLSKLALFTVVASILSTTNLIAEDYYMVKITGFMGETEYKAVPKAEYATIVGQIRNENHQFSNAQKLAEKEWNSGTHTSRYPGRGLHQRKITISRRFRSQNDAEAAVMKKEELIQKSLEKKERREYERSRRNNRNRRGGRNSYDPQQRTRERREASREKHKQSLEEAKAIFEKHLNALLAPKETESESTEADGDKADDKKQANKTRNH
jgi:hypothetical protein